MPDSDMNKVIEDLGRAFEEFKSANNAEIKELKKGSADFVTSDKLSRIQSELDKLVDLKSDMDKRTAELETKLNRMALSGQKTDEDKEIEAKAHKFNLCRSAHTDKLRSIEVVDAEAYKSYCKSFGQLLKSGAANLTGDETKSLSVGTDTSGGYVVPPDLSGRITTRVFETSIIRPYANQQTISTDALQGLTDKDEAGAGAWFAEGDSPSETTTPQLGGWRIEVKNYYAMPKATQQILDDANIDIEGWLAAKVADKFARVENAAFVNGSGNDQPMGICSYPTAATADSSRAWGTFEHVVTGVNGAFPTSNPADKLFDLEVAFKPQYLNNASIFTRRAVIQAIRKFKTGEGNYLWQPGLSQGKPATLIGYPVVLWEDMPALSSNGLSLAMGDMRQAYTIVDRQGTRLIRDNLTSKPNVLFFFFRRVGAGATQFEALKFLKFST